MEKIVIISNARMLFIFFMLIDIKEINKKIFFILDNDIKIKINLKNYIKVKKNKNILEIIVKKILYFFYFKYLIKKFNINNIQIFGCDHINGAKFFLKRYIFFLIEDGLTNYKKNIYKRTLKNKIFSIPSFGMYKNVKKIYLTGLAPIPEEIKDKVEIINLKELWNKKTEEEKKEILDIFGFDENIISKIKNKKNILFTQPLSEDRFISEEEKIELYKKIIFNYSEKDLVIKTHPREKTDYKKYFPEIEILNQSFPAELFDLLDIKFERAITIFSTAALNFSKNSKVDFYGTKVHPNLLKQWGDSEKIMKANKFLNGEPINE